MSANIGAIYGAQIFQADDKPLYRRAFGINLGLLEFALIVAGVRYGHERFKARKQ